METRCAQLPSHGECTTPSRVLKPFCIVSGTPPPHPPHPNVVLVERSGDPCPLPLVDAWATLQPALSPIAAETNARTSRAQPRRHVPLAPPKSAQKQVSLAHAKRLQVSSVTVSRTMNGRTFTTPPDLPASLRGHPCNLPRCTAHTESPLAIQTQMHRPSCFRAP